MGASIETTDGHAPLVSRGVAAARSTTSFPCHPPRSSRPCCSPALLAERRDDGRRAAADARSHGAPARARRSKRSCAARRVSPSWPAARLVLDAVEIPGDFSSAAPLLVAAATVPGSQLTVHGVGLNPRRTGLLDVLERMGARISVYNRRLVGGEPAGDVEVRASRARGRDGVRRRGAGTRRRASAPRSRRLPRARRDRRARSRRAAGEGVRPDRGAWSRSSAGSVRTSGRLATASAFAGVPARLRGGVRRHPRRPPARDARRGRRDVLARRRRASGRRRRGGELPGLLRRAPPADASLER